MEKQPLLTEKTPKLNYTKRYDEVSWRSADTDFEADPAASSTDEKSKVATKTSLSFCACSKRKRKIIVLVIVITSFLSIMSGLIYLYYSKPQTIEDLSTASIGTTGGLLKGLKEKVIVNGQDKETYAFKGIPYAVPPVDKLRFRKPVPLNKSNSWSGIYKAFDFGKSCVQNVGKVIGSEDCLYLNVYTPALNENANLPVFVWIHGGYLMMGNGNTLGYAPDSEFVYSMNVVAVSMNYRLNAFGFLTLKELWNEGISYGNYGIEDQILALRWVQNNIKKFGGDPNSVTVAGQSSGGTSIYGLLTAPSADGLFNNVIPMSGSPKFETYTQAAHDNIIFINNSRCSVLKKEQVKDCFLNLSKEELSYLIPYFQYPNWAMYDLLDFPTKGVFDGALIAVDPVLITNFPSKLKDIKYPTKKKVSVLLGTMAQEIGFAPVKTFYNSTWQQYESYLKSKLDGFSTSYYSKVINELYKNLTIENKTKNELVEYFHETITSDVRVNCPNNKLLHNMIQSEKHNVFRYVVTSRPSQIIKFDEYKLQFSFHAWDSFALFNFQGIPGIRTDYKPSSRDLNFQRTLRRNFKHFIQYGHMESTDWQLGKTGIFNVEGNVEVLKHDYHDKQCQFWNDPKNGLTDYAWIN